MNEDHRGSEANESAATHSFVGGMLFFESLNPPGY